MTSPFESKGGRLRGSVYVLPKLPTGGLYSAEIDDHFTRGTPAGLGEIVGFVAPINMLWRQKSMLARSWHTMVIELSYFQHKDWTSYPHSIH